MMPGCSKAKSFIGKPKAGVMKNYPSLVCQSEPTLGHGLGSKVVDLTKRTREKQPLRIRSMMCPLFLRIW